MTEIQSYLQRLMPIMRSITGEGLRESFKIISEIYPFALTEIPSGERVFDWTVPKEWVVRSATLKGPDGSIICDVANHPLHLLNYSAPFSGCVMLSELDAHLYSLPDTPEAIPYVTSYYEERWGFCLPHSIRANLPEGEYKVEIDTAFIDGALSFGEIYLEGDSKEEILLSSYLCHPSMANDELCAPLVLAMLARKLATTKKLRKSIRIVVVPETIGSICFLARKGEVLKRTMVAGYTLANIARDEGFRYKKSRQGSSLADRAMCYLMSQPSTKQNSVKNFAPLGSDERQYCSPGFDLPVGAITRSEQFFPEYHNSLDTLEIASLEAVLDTLYFLERLTEVIDGNETLVNIIPQGEPQLGKRGLYPTVGTSVDREIEHLATLWVLNYSDGQHDLLSIAEMSDIDFTTIRKVANLCIDSDILQRVNTE